LVIVCYFLTRQQDMDTGYNDRSSPERGGGAGKKILEEKKASNITNEGRLGLVF